MPSRSTYTLLRVRGIPVGVDWSWFLVLFIVIWFLSGFYSDTLGASEDAVQPYVLAVITALLFFGSILLHELGHAIVALRNGIGISHITLWMFGGVAGLERDSRTAGEEFRIAAAGPLVTLAIAAACLGLGMAIEGGAFWDVTAREENAGVSSVVAVLAWLANINVLILLFNMLPAYPLDGGRITRAAAWKLTGDRETGTKFAARLGQLLAVVMIGVGVYLLLATELFITGIWLAVIGWMLGSAARATVVRSELNQRIGDVSVADVMDDDPVAIPEDASVESALDEYFLRYEWPWFPVVDRARRFVGLINRGAADAVPEPSRATQRVAELIDTGGGPDGIPAETVRDDAPLESLLGNSELRRLGGLAAVDSDGRLSGVITLEQVGRALREAVGGGVELTDAE
ncbi:MAG TPA: site-2 protease family protein [Solirubrobacterales bacterium]|nr:site-2 protease family protein [Solirubrobacterales bacterium]